MKKSITEGQINASLHSAQRFSEAIGLVFESPWNRKVSDYSLATLDEILAESLISLVVANAAQGLEYQACMQDIIRLGLSQQLKSQDASILKSNASEFEIAEAAWRVEYAKTLFWSVGLIRDLIFSREDDDYTAVNQLVARDMKDLKTLASYQSIEQLLEQYIFYNSYLDIYKRCLSSDVAVGMELMVGPLGYQIVLQRANAFNKLITFN